MSGVANAIEQPFEDAWNWIQTNVIGPIGTGFSQVMGVVKDAWNAFARVWNDIQLHVPGVHIPGDGTIGGFTIGLPDLPTFAEGAYVKVPTLALVGEGKSGEFVAPEGMLRQLIREELGQGGIHITVNGALDPERVARQIRDILTQHDRRVGGVTRRGVTTGLPA
jgi:hypothetical protein